MERKLASVQRIASLSPIEGADQILKATVLGWELVVAKKDNLKVGDLVVYCEVDSIMPDKPEFEFLRERKFRIKTIKLRGQVSQGICFPLSILPKIVGLSNTFNSLTYKEGQDVTELLGVKKYDPQADFERKETDRLASIDRGRMDRFMKRYAWYRRLVFRPTKKPFPAFIKKTDEDRIQLFPNYYEKWGHLTFDVTEKLDGQSATYFCIPNPKRGWFGKKWIFGVCSRNFQLLKPDNSSYWTIAEQLRLKERMIGWCDDYRQGIIIQGEIIGTGIQGNKYDIKGYVFYVFNVISYVKGSAITFDYKEQDVTTFALGLRLVPYLKETTLKPTMAEMVESAKGKSILNVVVYREGMVVRNYENNISFKVINPDFLLKYSE